jgi:hypothetical protein
MDDPDTPVLQGLSRDRHVELAGRGHGPWWRRIGVGLLLAVAVLALANGFGQASSTTSTVAPAATLTVQTPARIRGGLLYQSRFDVVAHGTLTQPKLVLGSGWNDGLTINTLEPQPTSETSRDGKLVLIFDGMQPGDTLTFWVDYQVNPTHVGRTAQDVELDDGNTVLARLHRTLTVFP